MKNLTIFALVLFTILATLMSGSILAEGAKVTPLFKKSLDDLGNKEGLMLVVEYAPGMSSKKHRHDAHSFIYVLEGSVIMQVEGGPETILVAGDTFYENPADIHLVSKNASNSIATKFLVFTLKEKGAPVLTPIPQ